jgi:deoxyguanosine kinase
MTFNNKFIAIEGVIGVGKTTLARLLQPHFKSNILLEVFEENPFLAGFYKDRALYAFQTQIFFLLSRYHQQHQAVPHALQKGNLISDYTFAKDELFAWLNLKDDELAMYGRVHAALSDKIPKPNLIVYLYAEHEVVMRRIALRDRPYERDMDPNYILDLARAYEAWLTNGLETPIHKIDVTNLDFLSNPDDLAHVAGEIDKALAANGAPPAAVDPQMRLLQNGRLPDFQQFHQQLDQHKGFDQDIFYNYMLLTEEIGEVASEMVTIWKDMRKFMGDGRSSTDAHKDALTRHRAALRNELADVLAYTIKLANYADIDLEQAYLEKMQQNLGRNWTKI